METHNQIIAGIERPCKLSGGIERLEAMACLAVVILAWGILVFWGLETFSA
jgi:hypothetical protein